MGPPVPSRADGRRVRMATVDRREQIIDVATAQIAERGFWGVTLREIAASCGISEPGVLHHFASKDRLLIAVLEHRDERDRLELASRLGISIGALEADPAPFSLRALCTAAVERNATQPEIVRLYAVLQAESLSQEHPAFGYYRRRDVVALRLFERAARASGIGEDAVGEVARDTMAAMDGLQLHWLRQGASFDFALAWEAFADRFIPPPGSP